jgi:hypothetical protein
MKEDANRKHFSHSPRSSEKITRELETSFISRLANSEIPADARKKILGHSSEDIHGLYVYLEPVIQVKAIVNLHSSLSTRHLQIVGSDLEADHTRLIHVYARALGARNYAGGHEALSMGQTRTGGPGQVYLRLPSDEQLRIIERFVVARDKTNLFAFLEGRCPITVEFNLVQPIAFRQLLDGKRLHRGDECGIWLHEWCALSRFFAARKDSVSI